MKAFLLVIFCFFCMASFTTNEILNKKYNLNVEAKGCHYKISLNGQVIEEGKTYSRVFKNINLEKLLNDSVEQKIDVMIYRISREMTLKSTQAYLNLKLEKGQGDSLELIKEIKLPTFPYDDDAQQPSSIGGSINFHLK